ncbi:VOC family protein [Pseudomonas aeruginosa]|uniref:VOC family protein n=1 Tax=Pseudomonas aeruginosa TaxID=287 RepID=UPI000E30CEF9|nr:VOC family protein [Pseudomonas aeruginosa]MBH8861197.1 VOC family protein [Pseudomonas aeruginosa]MBI7342562.1 VOC family protein [Pseudomonas aeruginosa]MCV0332294.1 VOC family protein [Pseudomonas aeruginosa]MDG4469849.1 VOC family protein [Pseudomonas aeruginosa]NPZ83283.1 lactoylglutathione lyase [Pseudomonas aeruginosa]
MRILHSMLRVADLEAALEFYTRALAFVGYQDERAAAALELTHNWDRDGYTQGDGYGHLAIEVEDAAVTCARARALGYRVTREAGPMQHGRSVIAFLEDPDGYKVELIQKGTQFD